MIVKHLNEAALTNGKVVKILCKKLGLELLDSKYVDGEKVYVMGYPSKFKGVDFYVPIKTKYYDDYLEVMGDFTVYEYYLRKLGIDCNRFGNKVSFRHVTDINSILENIKDVISWNESYLINKLNQVKYPEDVAAIMVEAEKDKFGHDHVLNLDKNGEIGGVSIGPDADKVQLKGTHPAWHDFDWQNWDGKVKPNWKDFMQYLK